MIPGTFFISGIDTDIGKTIATGHIATLTAAQGLTVITHKPIQTGNTDVSEDILRHRAIMGCGLMPVDEQKLTMPQLFPYPCSPHLASRLANQPIDFVAIEDSITQLQQQFDTVLIEGAGGLMVPITEDLLFIDYIKAKGYPVILVTSGRLGSINHTLLSLEALRSRDIPLYALAYNQFHNSVDATINHDTYQYLCNHLAQYFPAAHIIDIPVI
ncbi:dethiobiotin synthase [Vitreoscilla massiliensis]|uniref:ATP-dependent dethiobiotin synthetase BioD n=1 Tax=Vitreoscilla massiliensis TaxID=1689272 RepID=A0ABY4DXI3_9NEIS|nr:dethiobiotin synthase [Vitreoscilla massiliensis]UOO87974.1 dethiobiotin synthase [Vitreoscilla massiliensis]